MKHFEQALVKEIHFSVSLDCMSLNLYKELGFISKPQQLKFTEQSPSQQRPLKFRSQACTEIKELMKGVHSSMYML